MDVNELIQVTREKGPGLGQAEYWFDLERKIQKFLNDPKVSSQDKELLRRKGQLEKVYMMCRGIEHIKIR